jgi:SAM-dependent methyltransferase
MRTVIEGVHVTITVEDLADPFPIYKAPWPHRDDSVEMVRIRDCITHLPHADARQDLPDALVVFMQEAYRVLQPGGVLSLVVPTAASPLAIASPLICRHFCRESFFAFGKPGPGMLPQEHYAESWAYKCFGVDFGTRFDIVELEELAAAFEVEMVKPRHPERGNGKPNGS